MMFNYLMTFCECVPMVKACVTFDRLDGGACKLSELAYAN